MRGLWDFKSAVQFFRFSQYFTLLYVWVLKVWDVQNSRDISNMCMNTVKEVDVPAQL